MSVAGLIHSPREFVCKENERLGAQVNAEVNSSSGQAEADKSRSSIVTHLNTTTTGWFRAAFDSSQSPTSPVIDPAD